MNRFTNKNGGILPFQMIKLAGAAGDVALTVRRGVGNVVQVAVNNVRKGGGKGSRSVGVLTVKDGFKSIDGRLTTLDGSVNAVGGRVDDLGRQVGDLGAGVKGIGDQVGAMSPKIDALSNTMQDLIQSGKATDEQLLKLREELLAGLKGLKEAAELGDTAAVARFNKLMDMNTLLAAKLPGRWSRIISGTALAGGASGLTLVGDRLLTRDAAAAHAAGAGDEGDLAGEQAGKGSWWENTWNDINKFREDHPGWFYGGLGVGLLGGGYALSEMLDDDDDEEEENNYNYRRY